jgi:hypothetical protein
MCAEASTVLRAVAADFLFNCWYLEIPSDIPSCVRYHDSEMRVKLVCSGGPQIARSVTYMVM